MAEVAPGCDGKTRYENKGEALRRLERQGNRISRRTTTRAPKANPYKCKHCGGWHIGRSLS